MTQPANTVLEDVASGDSALALQHSDTLLLSDVPDPSTLFAQPQISNAAEPFPDGESLRSMLNRLGGLPISAAIDVSLQLCSGLKEAHAQGIARGGLKPEFIIIDARGNARIADTEISRASKSSTQLTAPVSRAPGCNASEYHGNESVDCSADVYSLGLILYEMFTGTPLGTPFASAIQKLEQTPLPPRAIEPKIPANVERAILKCLEKEPARRFQSIAELEHALRAPAIHPPRHDADATPAIQPPHGSGSTATPAAAVHISIPLKPARRAPGLAWLLPAVAVALGAALGMHAIAIVRTAQTIQAPVRDPAPAPPDFALDKSVPEKEPDRVPGLRPSVPPDSVDAAKLGSADHPSESEPITANKN